MTKCYTYDMDKMRNIRGGLIKTVFTAVLAVIVVFTAVPFSLNADNRFVADPTGRRDGYAAYLYDNTTGLPTSEANAIAETSDGFIWIGSYGGLIRYDGKTFERYKSTTGITSVVGLFVDSKDRLWIGTNDNGAAVMDRFGNVKFFHKRDGLPSATVKTFAEDPEGNIYVGTTQGIGYVDKEGNLSVLDDSLIKNEYITVLETGADGITYGLTKNGDVLTLQGGHVNCFYDDKTLQESEIKNVHALQVDPNNPGYIYLGTQTSQIWHGTLGDKINFPRKDRISVSPLKYINSIEVQGNDLWVCANNGVCIYQNGEAKVFKNIPMESNIEAVKSDFQGNLWFASSRQGVMKMVPNQFVDVFDLYNLKDGVVNTTCYYDDKLFIGMDTGLQVIDKEGVVDRINLDSAVTSSGKNLGKLELIAMLKGVRIRSIIKDSKDRLWISTFGDNGLVRYDHGNVVIFVNADGMPSNRIRTLKELNDGSYLVACTGGLVVIRDDKIEKIYDENSGINNTEILTVEEGPNGDLIAGTDGDGIYILGSSGTRHFNTENGLISDVVMRIKKDNHRKLYWIVTSNSIAYMTFDYQIHTISDFPYSNNFDLFVNSQNEVWILSSNGLYVVDVEELLENKDIEPAFYGIDNGLPVIATSNSYSCVTDEGILYLAGGTGVAKVNIEKPFEKNYDVKMTVPYVDADGIRIYPDDKGVITIPSSVKSLTVYPHICSYSLINPQVTYELDGLGIGSTSTSRSDLGPVSYTNLKGGTYTFKMRIPGASGHGADEYSVVIVKPKNLHERVWFMACIVLLFIGIIAVTVYIYVRKKTRKLLKKQEENRILIREIVEAFAKMIDMKDRYTNGHSQRVAEYTAMLTRELGYDNETVEKYYNIALLHDIGKMGIPAEVLNKQGKLNDEEYHTIQSHTTLGYNVLKDISIMPELSVGAESHHERPDGKGYPQGLKGDEIPRVAQIIGVADAFDAMYSTRSYRKRMNFEKVVSIIKEASGTQFAEDVVEAFLRIVDQGGFKAPDDDGGGTMEDINNIHKRLAKEANEKEVAEAKKIEENKDIDPENRKGNEGE